MSKTSPQCPDTELSEKRQIAKSKRGFGLKKLGCSIFDKEILDRHAQSKDPMFKVRGIERFRRCNPTKISG